MANKSVYQDLNADALKYYVLKIKQHMKKYTVY